MTFNVFSTTLYIYVHVVDKRNPMRYYSIPYQRRKHANNPFTAKTGEIAIYMVGGSNCLISKLKSLFDYPIQRYAYHLYNDSIQYLHNSSIKVTSSCSVNNCVHPDHLKATYKPSKTDLAYIKQNAPHTDKDQLAHMLSVSPALLTPFL